MDVLFAACKPWTPLSGSRGAMDAIGNNPPRQRVSDTDIQIHPCLGAARVMVPAVVAGDDDDDDDDDVVVVVVAVVAGGVKCCCC
ncbi:uncharacterized protein ARB_02700 [Trichophyton benhamiae CBS 112371]|uniref:Uncharacterized protein n=1 Tax=Arthroderma benhamiae (strain ATCC MYA-4681 / CBS 112371) TaxID=663331 RepID=D4B2H2_ARTBC|nr:uncharacterized protein ARB_02700 [Trichophyton benhamiae CBS 112371]EFE30538.1 hypothetical protein ARB_02700 [Trichophyton benhamiae CBS 112371]